MCSVFKRWHGLRKFVIFLIGANLMKRRANIKKGQSAIEYLILATTITIVVLIGFDEDRGFLQQARNLTEGLFNQSLEGIMGTAVYSNTTARTHIDVNSGGVGYP